MRLKKLHPLLRNIHATTERGTFAYVQLIFESDNEDGISIKTKGVTMDNFTTIMNDTSVSWNTSPDNRCSVTPLDDEFWTSEDTDRDELKANIFEISRSDVVFNFIGEASLCLSRNGKFYYGTGAIATGEQPENYIYLLLNKRKTQTALLLTLMMNLMKKLFHNPMHGMEVGVNM